MISLLALIWSIWWAWECRKGEITRVQKEKDEKREEEAWREKEEHAHEHDNRRRKAADLEAAERRRKLDKQHEEKWKKMDKGHKERWEKMDKGHKERWETMDKEHKERWASVEKRVEDLRYVPFRSSFRLLCRLQAWPRYMSYLSTYTIIFSCRSVSSDDEND